MMVKVKLISLNVNTKIVPKCINIQRNAKYLGQAYQHLTGFPVGYMVKVIPVGYRVDLFPSWLSGWTGFPNIFIVCRGIFVNITNFIF